MTHRLWNVYQIKYLIYAERLENWGLLSHINSIFGDFYNFLLENWIISVSTDGNFTRYEWKCRTHWVLCICLHLGVEIEVYYSIIFHEKWHHLFRIKTPRGNIQWVGNNFDIMIRESNWYFFNIRVKRVKILRLKSRIPAG